MPEGDTIFRTATTLRRWLGGRQLTAVRTNVPGLDVQRLAGRRVEAVESRGKHLLIRGSGGLAVHTHLGMTGSWHLYPVGDSWRRSPRRARLVLVAGRRLAVCFDAPVVELLDAEQERQHPVLRRLGPDLLGPAVPEHQEVQRRADLRTGAAATVGELLLDQQVVAGIGNIYRCEALFLCGVHPATPSVALPDAMLEALVATAGQLLQANADPARRGARGFAPAGATPSAARAPWVYRRAGRPCRRCGTTVRSAPLGRQPRTAYWCPTCQPRPSGADP